jgi:hypothetical protein
MNDCTSCGTPPTPPPVSYESQIKPLFRPKDRNSMLGTFDLWSYDDVKEWAEKIHYQVAQGNMPCDNPWPQESVDLFEAWMKDGMLP